MRNQRACRSPARRKGEGGRRAREAAAGPPRRIALALERARRLARPELVPVTERPRGAIVLGRDARRAEGATVEFPRTPGLSGCAEHVALASASVLGIRATAIAVWTPPGRGSALPCGPCRQVLAELAPDAVVWIQIGRGRPRSWSVSALLPSPFGARSLPRRR